MASTFVSITISAYTCVVWRLVWKLTFFVIPASAAIFLRHLLHTPNIVSSNTFWLGLHPFRSGNQCKADWFRGIITCLPTISTFAVLRLSAYPHLAPHPSLYISVTVSERRAWSLSSRKASASILPWRTGRRRRWQEYGKDGRGRKSDHRLGRNFYKGLFGDSINVMLAAAAYNLKRAPFRGII